MIQHHGDFLLAKYPASWGVPSYQLGQRVYLFDSSNPATVTGLMFFSRPNHDGITEGEVGWWFQVELDESADRHFLEPVGLYQADAIHPLLPTVQKYYAGVISC